MEPKILAPFGEATEVDMSATGAQAVTVNNSMVVVDGVTTQATVNRTLDLTIDAGLPKGSQLLVTSKTAGTETLTFGTGITAPVITGVAGKTFTQGFVYDGVGFVPAGAAVQID